MEKYIHLIKNHVPEDSLPILSKWFHQRPFVLTLSKKRNSKYGDFRITSRKELPKISVNSNLNSYAFLITLTHEFAHLLVWHNHKHKAKAHGIEWKNEFSMLMAVLLSKNIFPDHLAQVLELHIKNPPASSARDVQLVKELKIYDPPSNLTPLHQLNEGEKFSLNNKRIFIKGKKRRTRFLCKEASSNKEYLIHGVADVLIIK